MSARLTSTAREIMRSRPTGAAVLCAAGVAVAGCGGSSGSTSSTAAKATSSVTTVPATQNTAPPTTPPKASAEPTKAQFIARADRICRQANALLKQPASNVAAAVNDEERTDTAAHRAAVVTALREESALARPQLDRLRALTPPAPDHAAVGNYLAAVAGQISLTDQLAAAFQSDDTSAIASVAQQIPRNHTTVDSLAQGYGFKVCGHS